MAPVSGIEPGEGGGRPRRPNAVLHLVPLIDLLLCCVMFLLAVVAWNQLGSPGAVPSVPIPEQPASRQAPGLEIRLLGSGYLLQPAGDRPTRIPKVDGGYDLGALRVALKQYADSEPRHREVSVRPEDGVAYADVVQVMEAVSSARLNNVAAVDPR